MAHTLPAASPTPQNHAQARAGQCAASQLFVSGPGGQGADVRPPSDTVNTGGGAVKMRSCQGGTCKSQAQSLKDKKFGSESIRPRLKGPGSSLLQQKTHIEAQNIQTLQHRSNVFLPIL